MFKFNRLSAVALGVFVSAAVVGAASAHHSFAMFDSAKTVTLDGQVQDFTWTNPHCTLRILAKQQPNTEPQLWTIELTSPGNLTRTGWSRTILKPGDHAVVQMHPLRNGERGGGLVQVTMAGGQVLTQSGVAPATVSAK